MGLWSVCHYIRSATIFSSNSSPFESLIFLMIGHFIVFAIIALKLIPITHHHVLHWRRRFQKSFRRRLLLFSQAATKRLSSVSKSLRTIWRLRSRMMSDQPPPLNGQSDCWHLSIPPTNLFISSIPSFPFSPTLLALSLTHTHIVMLNYHSQKFLLVGEKSSC